MVHIGTRDEAEQMLGLKAMRMPEVTVFGMTPAMIVLTSIMVMMRIVMGMPVIVTMLMIMLAMPMRGLWSALIARRAHLGIFLTEGLWMCCRLACRKEARRQHCGTQQSVLHASPRLILCIIIDTIYHRGVKRQSVHGDLPLMQLIII